MENEKTKTIFKCLAVTHVKVYPFKSHRLVGNIKGIASVVLNDQLLIHGLRIMGDENGLFVVYPNHPLYNGEDFKTICNPITRKLREHIENCILEKYQAAIG